MTAHIPLRHNMGKQRRQMLHGRTVVAENEGQQDKKGLQLKEKEDVFSLLAGIPTSADKSLLYSISLYIC